MGLKVRPQSQGSEVGPDLRVGRNAGLGSSGKADRSHSVVFGDVVFGEDLCLDVPVYNALRIRFRFTFLEMIS